MNATNTAANPPQALDGLTNPAPLTLGQLALLEKVGSPFLKAAGVPLLLDLLPSLYLLALPAAEGVAHLKTLEADALAWADTLAPGEVAERSRAAQAAVNAYFAALPKATEDEGTKPKNPSPATAPS